MRAKGIMGMRGVCEKQRCELHEMWPRSVIYGFGEGE